jgi:hypothetical protein
VVAHIITALDQVVLATLVDQHQAVTHKVVILVTIIKATLPQDLAEQVVISLDIGVQMEDQEL